MAMHDCEQQHQRTERAWITGSCRPIGGCERNGSGFLSAQLQLAASFLLRAIGGGTGRKESLPGIVSAAPSDCLAPEAFRQDPCLAIDRVDRRCTAGISERNTVSEFPDEKDEFMQKGQGGWVERERRGRVNGVFGGNVKYILRSFTAIDSSLLGLWADHFRAHGLWRPRWLFPEITQDRRTHIVPCPTQGVCC
ncbi:hypothetical protein DL89DRAFT_178423 [Linderina pennispora]|uniref:Uncharacterized protein n=1 Tax=Linderina pennispora TaxID=61395 RepID=A0A1Y1W512_9FUNG|nr:uncharacterized protein DL89DRAFT_178423 [Linderina pennispora]ORX68492.1 hypothetical protein DL89DRAFT_178423 [Linderina pennispora]